MQKNTGKFLVDLFHSLNSREWFFLTWFMIVFGFVYLLAAYKKKADRRNFKEGRRNKILPKAKIRPMGQTLKSREVNKTLPPPK